MTDAMEVAKQRKKDYETQISKKQAEIAELQEMIGDLDSFMEFGNELLSGPAKSATSAPTPAAPSAQVKSQPSPQLKEVPNKTPAGAKSDDDDWGDDDAQQSIARVLSARQG